MTGLLLKYIIPPVFILGMFGAAMLYAYWAARFLDWLDRWRAQ